MKQFFRQVGIPKGMQILQFAQKLRPELSQKVMDSQCATLEQAILLAAQYEANERYTKDHYIPPQTSSYSYSGQKNHGRQYNNPPRFDNMPHAMQYDAEVPMEIGFVRKTPENFNKGYQRPTVNNWNASKFDGQCNKCGKYGHRERDWTSSIARNQNAQHGEQRPAYSNTKPQPQRPQAHFLQEVEHPTNAKQFVPYNSEWAAAWRPEESDDDEAVALMVDFLPDAEVKTHLFPPAHESYNTSSSMDLPDALVGAFLEIIREDPAAQETVNKGVKKMKVAARCISIEESNAAFPAQVTNANNFPAKIAAPTLASKLATAKLTLTGTILQIEEQAVACLLDKDASISILSQEAMVDLQLSDRLIPYNDSHMTSK